MARTYEDISNLYIKYPGHPTYSSGVLECSDTLDGLIQKLEMIVFTNKGETSDPNFGADMERMLWSTNLSSERIRDEVITQIATYIPELPSGMYDVSVEIYEGTYRDIGVINITINGDNFVALFS